jgi:glutamate-1-semialdehyde aminotransferase
MTRTEPEVRIDRRRLAELTEIELDRFRAARPRSAELHREAEKTLIGGVPMNWMNKWATAAPIAGDPRGFPIFIESAQGAELVDVDDHRYVDFCLGDTGAMTGHSPQPIVEALGRRAPHGFTFMLPTPQSIEASRILAERFGLAQWHFTVSATDANRFSIRLARRMTNRRKILIFDHCYHGSVDESFAGLDAEGNVVGRDFNMGAPVPLAETTRVVAFNDLAGLERELAQGDVACVITEPALTNVGIVLPQPGFHQVLRELTRKAGALLIVDETHTISAGPGGYTAREGLDPDILTIGKAVASGLPAGAYGISEELASTITGNADLEETLTEGIGTGGTLAGNGLTAELIAVTLSEVLTDAAFKGMIELAARWAEGVEAIIQRNRLPWTVTVLGARAEYAFTPEVPVNGAQLAAVGDEHLERYLRIALINRGVITTPFHNMALVSPATAVKDVDLHTRALDEAVTTLLSS